MLNSFLFNLLLKFSKFILYIMTLYYSLLVATSLKDWCDNDEHYRVGRRMEFYADWDKDVEENFGRMLCFIFVKIKISFQHNSF